MATTTSTPEAILDAVGGAENIIHFTHCATRLRFELKDASGIDKAAVEAIPGVMGAVPQSGDRYQIVIGGAVQSVYDEINSLPAMKNQGGSSGSGQSDADVKAAARAKARGKNAYVDAFFEYLSDSFRPLLPALLGASLIIAGEAICEAFGLINTHADATEKPATLLFVDAMFRAVFYFLPVMVAYNASKKLKIDPWVGTAIMAALLTPEFVDLEKHPSTTCIDNATINSKLCTAHIAGLPMQLNGYGGQVFVPLMMVAILALVYKGLVKVVPTNVQMVFVPFLSFVIMMPVTAFLIGPLGIWIGTGLGTALFWLNSHAPIIFAILIPMVYPFLVPLGLHWPLNALMLANIASAATNHTDFIQGPMGAWNFACFGATAAVLVWSFRDKDDEMRQTATGALFAGLLGGISEPSLYGIHLRFKRIYPFMLVGCAVGGLVQGIGSMLGGIEGVTTTTFVFTSLLTIPVFNPMWLYGISVAAAFATSFFLIVTFGYRTKEERAEALAAAATPLPPLRPRPLRHPRPPLPWRRATGLQRPPRPSRPSFPVRSLRSPRRSRPRPWTWTRFPTRCSPPAPSVRAWAWSPRATSSSRLQRTAPSSWPRPRDTPSVSPWTAAWRSSSTWVWTPSTWRARASTSRSPRATASARARSSSVWTAPSSSRPVTR